MSVATDAPNELLRLGEVASRLLDALPDATAILDQDGTIVAVNRVWRMFSLDNGGDDAKTGVGTNYLDVCERSSARGCSDATVVANGIGEVLAGETVERDFEYACPSPAVGRWFISRITGIHLDSPGVLVSHTNITRRKIAE
ncbi:MAG: PAS domain-containing protein, partial [Candidatus Nanopelagicales bacterium]